jgi:hypothetical protein
MPPDSLHSIYDGPLKEALRGLFSVLNMPFLRE